MLRPFVVHPVSVLIGIFLAGSVALLISASPQSSLVTATPSPMRLVGPTQQLTTPPFSVSGIPSPAQMVRLTAADLPYTVPPNRALVIKTFGATSSIPGGAVNGQLKINGQGVLNVWAETGSIGWGMNSVQTVEPGVVAKAGSVVTFSNAFAPTYDVVMLGYLADI